jgi:hypothetical protein
MEANIIQIFKYNYKFIMNCFLLTFTNLFLKNNLLSLYLLSPLYFIKEIIFFILSFILKVL